MTPKKVIIAAFGLTSPIMVKIILHRMGMYFPNSIQFGEIQGLMIAMMVIGYLVTLIVLCNELGKKGLWIAACLIFFAGLMTYLALPSRYHCYNPAEFVGAVQLVACE